MRKHIFLIIISFLFLLIAGGYQLKTVYAGHIGHEANFCEGNSIVHEYADGTHEFQHECNSDSEVCKALPNDDAGCAAKDSGPGPQHECASDGDRSAEAGDSSTANCAGHKQCHYEGKTLKWGGYLCEYCTNGANNPPSCNNQSGPDSDCKDYQAPCPDGTHIRCHNGIAQPDNTCKDGPNSSCDSQCPSTCPDWKYDPTTPTVCGETVQGGVAHQVCNYEADTCTGATRVKAGSCKTVAGSCGEPSGGFTGAPGTGGCCSNSNDCNKSGNTFGSSSDPNISGKSATGMNCDRNNPACQGSGANSCYPQCFSCNSSAGTWQKTSCLNLNSGGVVPTCDANHLNGCAGGGAQEGAFCTGQGVAGKCWYCGANRTLTDWGGNDALCNGVPNCPANKLASEGSYLCKSTTTSKIGDPCTTEVSVEKKACYICDNTKPAGQQRRQWTSNLYTAADCATQNGGVGKPSLDSSQSICETVTPKYKCSSSGTCTRDDALGTFTTPNCDNSCSPTHLTCSAFSPNGLSDSGQVGPGGIKIYNTADFRGGRRLLNVTRSPANAAIGHPASTKNPATAPDLAFEAAADGSGNWIVNIPDNNSTTTDNDYTVSAAVSSGSASANCTPFVIHVPKKPAETVCPVNITSTQVRMRAAAADNWSTGLSMNAGESVFVAGFHNNQTDTYASDIILTATGPDGPQNRVVTLNSSSAPNNVSFAPTLPGRYTITATKNDKTGPNCTGSAVLTVSQAPVVITAYRFAQNPTDLETAPFKPYSQQGALEGITFSDLTLGQKCVFVQFRDSNGNITERKNECINFVGPDPTITGSACNIKQEFKENLGGHDLLFEVRGEGFGTRDLQTSQLSADNANLEIREWTPQKVVARMANPPDTRDGKTYNISLTRADGVKVPATCSVNIRQISFGAKLFCRAPSKHDQDGVNLTLVQNALGVGTTATVATEALKSVNFRAGTKTTGTVTINKEGVVVLGNKLQIQDDVEYIACLKAPKGLRVCTPKFRAIAGNNIMSANFNDVPLGDYNSDDVINGVDFSILKSQWGPMNANKVCDLNKDGVCNSFEGSCVIHDFDKSSQAEP